MGRLCLLSSLIIWTLSSLGTTVGNAQSSNVSLVMRDWDEWVGSLQYATKKVVQQDYLRNSRDEGVYQRARDFGKWEVIVTSEIVEENESTVAMFNERYIALIRRRVGTESWRLSNLEFHSDAGTLKYLVDLHEAEKEIFQTRGWWYDLPRKSAYRCEYSDKQHSLVCRFTGDPITSNGDKEPIEVTYFLRKEHPWLPEKIVGRSKFAEYSITVNGWNQVMDKWTWNNAEYKIKWAGESEFKPLWKYTFSLLPEAPLDRDACYLSYYGLPEPSPPRKPWMFVIGVLVVLAVVVGGFWQRHRRKEFSDAGAPR